MTHTFTPPQRYPNKARGRKNGQDGATHATAIDLSNDDSSDEDAGSPTTLIDLTTENRAEQLWPIFYAKPSRAIKVSSATPLRKASGRPEIASSASLSSTMQRWLVTAPTNQKQVFTIPDVLPVQAPWPSSVEYISNQYNPSRIKFANNPPEGPCGCRSICVRNKCKNGKVSIFCDPVICPYGGLCGNGLTTSTKLRLCHSKRFNGLTLVAVQPINKGEVLGEYVGELISAPLASPPPCSGNYILQMKDLSENPKDHNVFIDARQKGNLMRFLNHSCDPVAYFAEVFNGRRHTVIAVTHHAAIVGEEITVDYNNTLPFVCRCGSRTCIHRALQ